MRTEEEEVIIAMCGRKMNAMSILAKQKTILHQIQECRVSREKSNRTVNCHIINTTNNNSDTNNLNNSNNNI